MSLPEHRAQVSLSLAVAKETEIMFTYAGEVVAYMVRDGQMRQLVEGEAPPLGIAEEVKFGLSCWSLQPGDALLLSVRPLHQILDQRELARILSYGDGAAIVDQLYAAYQASPHPLNFSAVLIQFPRNYEALLPATEAARPPLRLSLPTWPPSPKAAETSPRWRPTPRRRWLAVIALFAVLLIALLWIITNSSGFRLPSSDRPQSVPFWQQKTLAVLDRVTDPASRRWLLGELMTEAGGPNSVAPEAKSQWEQLNRITTLDAVRLVGIEGSEAGPKAVVADGQALYVLIDEQVWRYPLDSSGSSVAGARSLAFGRAGAGTAGLLTATGFGADSEPLILARDGVLWALRTGQGLVPLATVLNLPQGQIIAGTYQGVIYLLVGGNIQRLYPNRTGAYVAGEPYFLDPAPAELSRTVDLAVDGNVYLLLDDAQILKFYAGQRQPFPASLPDSPLRDATALFASERTRSVYVADRGNRRIVQLSKEGQFQRQFRGRGDTERLLANVTDLFVDETREKLYFVNSGGMYALDLSQASPSGG